MTSRPVGPKPYDGPVILPGSNPGAVPVDPSDPSKGTMTPVASAIELTAGVTELYGAVNFLNSHIDLLANAMTDGFADIGKLLEDLIRALADELADGDTAFLGASVNEFLDARQKARDEADAAAAEEAERIKAEGQPDRPFEALSDEGDEDGA